MFFGFGNWHQSRNVKNTNVRGTPRVKKTLNRFPYEIYKVFAGWIVFGEKWKRIHMWSQIETSHDSCGTASFTLFEKRSRKYGLTSEWSPIELVLNHTSSLLFLMEQECHPLSRSWLYNFILKNVAVVFKLTASTLLYSQKTRHHNLGVGTRVIKTSG